MIEAQIVKNGSVVAKTPDFWHKQVDWVGFDPAHQFDLYYFPKVTMSPPLVFEHMSGRGLMSFFDLSSLTLAGKDGSRELCTRLRYVHGRSEVMKGNPSITAVLLARPLDSEVDQLTWLTFLPQIYKNFLSIYAPH
jgi:hypothetical protein